MIRLIYATGDNCTFCEQQDPIWNALQSNDALRGVFPEPMTITASNNPYNVQGTPTFLTVIDNQVIGRLEGLQSETAILNLVQQAQQYVLDNTPIDDNGNGGTTTTSISNLIAPLAVLGLVGFFIFRR